MSPKETSRLLRQKSSDFEASHAMAGVTSPSRDDDLSSQAVNGLLDMETPIPDMELCITSDGHLDVWKETRVFLCMCPCYWFRFLVAQLALDTELIFVGHLGVPQLAGVGLVRFWVAIPFWFLYSSMRAVYVFGVQARQHGIDRTAGLWLQTGLGFAFIGTVAVIIYYLRSPDMARFAEFNDVTIAFAREYAPIILLGLFPCLAFAAMDNFMRVQGITLPALVCATIACVLNITLHFVFIFGAFGWSGRGFVGSPWATVTSLVVQLILYVAYTVAIKRYHAPFWCEWSWESHRFGQYRLFWKVAAPLGGAAMVLAIAFCIIGTITSYVPPTAATPTRVLRQLDDADVDAGSERAGAWVISFCLFFVVVAIFLGVAETTKIRMLVYFANGRSQLARKVLYVGLAYGVAIAAVFVALLLVYKSVVFRIWTNDTGVLAQCIDVVRWIGVCLMFASMRTVLASGLIVLQKRPMVVLAQTLDIWCCQVPCSFVLPILLNFPGLNGFWIAVATGECVHVLLLLYALCQTGGTIDDLAFMEVVQAVVVNQRHLAANQDMEGLKHGNYGKVVVQRDIANMATSTKDASIDAADERVLLPLHPSHGPRVQSRTQPDAAPVDMELAISLRGILPPSATTALSFSPQLCTKSPMSSDAGSEASEDGAAPVHSNMDETGSVASSTGKPRRRPKSSNGPLPPSGQVETLGGVDIATLQFGKRSKKRRTREEKLRRVMSTSPARRPSASSFQASLD
ncbi:hypothetical protein DYB32_007772 [Aphanomyces invadans]|uniref:MATE efflux family protein n=1 Tax=Aphanomyces invadans TaxID=157072 RepID=A0A418AQ92_9STRA|nr:hypothetical protein DYB32_007772 [Aphanomyces invadans]